MLLTGAIVALIAVPAASPSGLHSTQQVTNVNCGPTGATSATLQTAIDNAVSGDIIKIKGVCKGNYQVNNNIALELQGDPLVNGEPPTVLQGVGPWPSPTLDIEAGTVHVDRLKITGGPGGGVTLNSAKLLMTFSHVTGNGSRPYDYPFTGGGLFISGAATLQHTTVDNNLAETGGGIYVDGGSKLTVEQASRVNSNQALDNTVSGGYGGGIYAAAGTAVNVSGSRVWSNTAAAGGGGVYSQGSVTLYYASVRTNTAYPEGGGVFNDGGTLHVASTLVSGNSAGSAAGYCSLSAGGGMAPAPRGGGIANEGGTVSITSSLSATSRIDGNESAVGGGIFSSTYSAPAKVAQTRGEIAHNTAVCGGGMYLWDPNGLDNVAAPLKNVGVHDNSASSLGGGIVATGSSSGTVMANLLGSSKVFSNSQGGVWCGALHNVWPVTAAHLSGNSPSNNTGC
jgi:hypothetical protein